MDSFTAADGKEISYEYDSQNLLTKMTDYDGSETRYEYGRNEQYGDVLKNVTN